MKKLKLALILSCKTNVIPTSKGQFQLLKELPLYVCL